MRFSRADLVRLVRENTRPQNSFHVKLMVRSLGRIGRIIMSRSELHPVYGMVIESGPRRWIKH